MLGSWHNLSSHAWLSMLSPLVLAAAVSAQIAGWRKDRFSRSLSTLTVLDARFESPDFRELRRKAAYFLKDGPVYDQAGREALSAVLNFFETIGFLLAKQAVDAETVWRFFGPRLVHYHAAAQDEIKTYRLTHPGAYLNLEKACKSMSRLKAGQRLFPDPASPLPLAGIRTFLEGETAIRSMPPPIWVPQTSLSG